MNCLDGLIGLKGCSSGTLPGSGLYVNSLPGLPMELIDRAADIDQQTYAGVWADAQLMAQGQLLSDFETLMADKFQLSSIARSFCLPQTVSEAASPQGAYENGFTLDLGDNHPISRLMQLHVDRLGIYLIDVPEDPFNITIANYDTGQVLWSRPVNTSTAPLSVGWNFIDVLENFWCKHLKFVYTASEANTAQVPLDENTNAFLCGCYCKEWEVCPGQVRGISDTAFSDTVSYGLMACISFTCSYEPLICANRKSFARALWFLLGSTLLSQALGSHRYSRYNTTDKEKVAGLRDGYYDNYVDTLKQVAKGIRLNDNDYCLECDHIIRNQFVFP